jgi:hypothetical protein
MLKRVLIAGEVLKNQDGALTVRLDDGFANALVMVTKEKARPLSKKIWP